MNITFSWLQESDFPLLFKWLETSHVKNWWDSDITWTPELIKEKYISYAQGYKLEHGARRGISAFIIHIDETPIGYIQYYNAHDFTRNLPLIELPESLAAIDFFIGEPDFLGKRLGSQILQLFIRTIIEQKYEYIFVDPDINNIAAAKTYEDAGFKKIEHHGNEVWMLLKR